MSPLFTKLKKDSHNWANEEEVRKSWLKHIENELGIAFHAERGRNDASYNQVIIEFKDKGLFRGSTASPAFREAIYDRLHKYIPRRAKEEGLAPEDYIGIATDGDHICFAFYKDGQIVARNLLPFNAASISLVAQACADSKRRAVTADNLVEDFGHEAEIGHGMMQVLSAELAAHVKAGGNNKIKMLFEEWRTLFGQVADLSAAQATAIQRQIPMMADLPNNDAVAALLFTIHTYNAFLMKLLAAEIVAEYKLTAHPDFCEHLLGYEDDELLRSLDREVERSAYFEGARIKGFVEEAVFSWYADASLSASGRRAICSGIRGLLTQLSLYRMDDLNAARSRDVLKAFYQSLIPEVLRKALGEFYTPDWLVDVACDRASVKDWFSIRVLDPTCGSGSFLLEAIRRKRKAAEAAKLDAKATLANILANVWGFDLNPLAVQASRVNFLIAIADLVAAAKIEIELPILLADAVYSPAHVPEDHNGDVKYRIGSSQSDLLVVLPATLAFDRSRLDDAFLVMGDSVEDQAPYELVERVLIAKNIITAIEAEKWRDALAETYGQVLVLHQQAWNGIWFRIVRNFFWSAVAGQFDLIIGNPPWVRWSNLPEIYRDRIKPTCEQYAIFSETPFHGGNELDISGMITYTVGDKWLKDGGTLVFVITQTHFQSPSSQGFRSFSITKNASFIPVEVDDLRKLKPFAKVANRSAIMRLQKVAATKKPSYPIPYRIWEKAGSASAVIPESLLKNDVEKRVAIKNWEAIPVEGGNSPWAVLPKGRFKDMAKIQGRSDWIAGRKGVTTDLNGVYMVRIVDTDKAQNLFQIETRPEAGRTDIGPARKFWVEPDFLYPLIKGAGDFSACHLHIEDDLYMFIPNKGIQQADYASAMAKMATLKLTEKYFKAFKTKLSTRATYKQRQPTAPYYVVYNSGAYTFAPYKVMWAEQSSTFEAVVVENTKMPLNGKRPYVPDHKVFFADFTDADTAYFVCGILNSALVREYVESHTIQIQVSNIFKHLSIPRFDPKNVGHRKVIELCRQAHAATTDTARKSLLADMDIKTEALLKA
ncbi:Eco57I restriction-modification methylase domain-containing protein [Methyloferula stellata]|uniref:Eco57I restriction-modification methylase domain-containing protein n=1 Tax=Methyloferula stellata TaxID=876270 RepID=UPI0003764E6C|nr:N-6 DNA methylase [Methyloferula stellata]